MKPYTSWYEGQHQGSLVQYTGMGFGQRTKVLPPHPISNSSHPMSPHLKKRDKACIPHLLAERVK